MNAHRVETVVGQDRKVVLEDLPFQAGEAVVVTSERCLGHIAMIVLDTHIWV